MAIDRAHCQQLDSHDPLSGFKARFQSPQKHTIFLDANSMGAMPATVPDRLASFCTDEWVELRRQGWNHTEWLDRPRQIGNAIAHLMGAGQGNIVVCDNTTVNLYKILTYAWQSRKSGSTILTEDGNFPTGACRKPMAEPTPAPGGTITRSIPSFSASRAA